MFLLEPSLSDSNQVAFKDNTHYVYFRNYHLNHTATLLLNFYRNPNLVNCHRKTGSKLSVDLRDAETPTVTLGHELQLNLIELNKADRLQQLSGPLADWISPGSPGLLCALDQRQWPDRST